MCDAQPQGSRAASFFATRLGTRAATEKRMNRTQIEGKLDQLKGDIKSTWAKLTSDDLNYIGGRIDHLVGRLRERYGLEKEQAEKQVDEWVQRIEKKMHGTGSTDGTAREPASRGSTEPVAP